MVASDIEQISRFFKGPLFILGDIFQPGEGYAEKLLRLLRRKRLDNHMVLEFFDIPPIGNLKMLTDSIPHLNIQLSPETHDAKIRAAFGRPYDNERMEQMLEELLKLGCHKFDLFFMIGLPYQDPDSVMETVEYIDFLLERFGKNKNLFPYISPLAPFLDPGSKVYENPERFGYKLLCHTLEEHRRALLGPSWKYMLNYQTKWMNRDQIVEVTYQSALKLNQVKHKHGLIKNGKFKDIESRIQKAQSIIRAIDEQVARRGVSTVDDTGDNQEEDANSSLKSLKISTICDKNELKWPVRFLRFNLPGGSLRFLALLRLKNIISLILRGHDVPPRNRERPS